MTSHVNSIPLNNPNHNYFLVPKEVLTTSLGITLGAISNLAIQLLNWNRFSLASNFMFYGFGAGSIVETVITIYSTIHLCQKMTSGKIDILLSVNKEDSLVL